MIAGIVIGVLILSGVISNGISHLPTTDTTTTATATTQQAQTTDTSAPTDTPVPTQTQAQIESAYKASTTSTSVASLDKNGNADQGNDIHFLCQILSFVKDASGNTAGANVTTPDSYSGSVVQVAFTSGTDITKLNEGDTLEVWGTDEGVFSGTNAFGATVQEVSIMALYMFDHTTNYQANS